jgi:SSS family solute:Na+ symporter
MFLSFFGALIFCWHHFGGLSVLTARLPETHFTWHGGNPAQYVLVWYVIAMATLVEPAFYQRCFAAKSHRVARRGIFVSVLFWLVFDAMTTTVGLYARAFLPNIADPTLAFPVFAADILPPFLGAVFILGLLATVMSTIDSYAFLSAITLGRDIIWRFRGGSDESSQQLSAWGLIVTGAIAVIFALSFKSVVDIWHDFGSVGTPALLLPLAAAFSRRDLLKPGHAFLMMILAGLTSLGWLIFPYFAPALKGNYPWGVEPIFPGLIVSAALFLLFVKRYPVPK